MPKRSVEYFYKTETATETEPKKPRENPKENPKENLKENQTPNHCDAAQDVQTKEQNRCIEREYPLQSIETIYMYIYYIGTLS